MVNFEKSLAQSVANGPAVGEAQLAAHKRGTRVGTQQYEVLLHLSPNPVERFTREGGRIAEAKSGHYAGERSLPAPGIALALQLKVLRIILREIRGNEFKHIPLRGHSRVSAVEIVGVSFGKQSLLERSVPLVTARIHVA